MAKNLKPYPIRIEETLFNKFKVVAEANHRTIVGHISYLMDEAVKDFENKYGPIELGRDSLDE